MMKSISLVILFLALTGTTGHTQEEEFSKKEKAIVEVIESESEYFWARDHEKWADLYVHAPYTVWTSATQNGVRRYKGWPTWNKQVKQLFKNDPKPQPYKGVVHKYNYNFRIYGKGAWVSFEQMNEGTKTLETRIMEKVKGKWKIAMVEVIYDVNESIPETEGETEGQE